MKSQKTKTGITLAIVMMYAMGIVDTYAQQENKNTLNYGRLYGLALNQDIKTLLEEIDSVTVLSNEDENFKSKYENRFKYEYDKTDYFLKNDTALNSINRIYQDYWRKSLIDNSTNFDKPFEKKILGFLKSENFKIKFTDLRINMKTLVDVYKSYIKSKGYHGGYGKVGSLFDFLVWKNESDTTYNVKLICDTVLVNVTFMTGFISLGWEEYATFGKYYPGGWSTSTSLFCVKESYDLKSEKFLVNYLSHEGQHFSDLKRYPKLVQKDLEYRAKLTELYFADNYIYSLIKLWINNSKYDINNAHPFANYCIIRDMSKLLFGIDFQKDLGKWRQIPKEAINNAAKQLFIQNTDKLDSFGNEVVSLIN